MATVSVDKHKEQSDELTKALNDIITQNLTIGVSKLGNDTDDVNDEHVDTKSNASFKWRRGSVSYSQPSSPKGNPSLSPVTSVSSLSELSTEYPDDGDSESCASLNSVNSVNSTMSNHSSLDNIPLHQLLAKELIIDENKANIDPVSIDNHNDDDDNNNIDGVYINNKNNENKANNDKKDKKENKSNNRMNNNMKINNKLNISSNRNKKQHKHKHKKKKHKLRKSNSYEPSRYNKSSKSKSKYKQRRNSKDCLDITAISRLATKPIEKWSISEVIEWVKLIDHGKYKEYAEKFEQKKIDGKKLFKMNRSMLQSIEIYHPSARKAILAALQKLKAKVRQTERKQINIYAKKHQYEKKKHQKKHRRGISTPNGSHFKQSTKNEMYVVAIKKHKSDHSINMIPGMMPSLSAPSRKQSQDISEFLHEWEIKQSQDSNINFINSIILEQTDNFTMIKLENKRIVYAITAKVEKWNNNDVCKWLNSVSNGRFKRFIPKFKERNTNGFDLLNISRVQLQNNINMMDPTMRNGLLREIKLLKIATKPPKHKLLKKRTSAISIADIEASNLKAAKKSGHRHRKSASLLTGTMPGLSRFNKLNKSQSSRVEDLGFVPRKLGPRDIGRNNYKGTKYDRDLFNFDFMEEKINYHVKTEQFNKRKQQNPVKHKQTVTEIGISTDFEKPEYTNDVLRNINRTDWLKEKPISRRNIFLDSLKGQKIPKGDLVSDLSTKPIGWTPIEYKFKNDGKEFLEEHFWFDGSGVQFEFGFSRLLNNLPPLKQLELNKQPAPTGYESKLNWLRMLLNMVTEEMKIIQKEDAAYDVIVEEEDDIDDTVPIINEPPRFFNVIQEEKEEKVDQIIDIDDKDNKEDENESIVDVNKFRRSKNMDETKENITSSASSSSESEHSEQSDYSSPSSPDMTTKRKMYKAMRNRSNTTLANSRLGGIANSPMTPRTRKRVLSRQDINRRRFFSQESVDSIQAIIANIEKKRAAGNIDQ